MNSTWISGVVSKLLLVTGGVEKGDPDPSFQHRQIRRSFVVGRRTSPSRGLTRNQSLQFPGNLGHEPRTGITSSADHLPDDDQFPFRLERPLPASEGDGFSMSNCTLSSRPAAPSARRLDSAPPDSSRAVGLVRRFSSIRSTVVPCN